MGNSDLLSEPRQITKSESTYDQWAPIISRARNGCRESFDLLARNCWEYLLLAARSHLAPDLQAKLAPSDLVQQTLMLGYANFNQFNGESEREFLNWLETILNHQAVSTGRTYRQTQARQINREIPLETAGSQVAINPLTPSQFIVNKDQQQLLRDSLARLPEHYRTVLTLHSLEGQTFEAIGLQTGRSADAARKLWLTALRSLKQLMAQDDGISRRG